MQTAIALVVSLCALSSHAFQAVGRVPGALGSARRAGEVARLDAMKELGSERAFDQAIKAAKEQLVIVDFATTWCGPCKVMEPKVAALSEEYGDAIFYKVTGDASADASALMKREGVRAVPSFHFWKNGEKVDVVNGANIDAVTSSLQKHI